MFGRRLPGFVAVVALILALVPLARPAAALSTTIVISQIYGGGGNSGATLRNDFIELFNRGTATVCVTGWSVQYASAAGTTWAVTALSGSSRRTTPCTSTPNSRIRTPTTIRRSGVFGSGRASTTTVAATSPAKI